MTVTVKSPEEIAKMRVAGQLGAEVLDFITPHVRAGVTTDEIDRLCHDYMVNVQRTVPAPLNYAPPGYTPYPKSVCTSVNHVVCHGVPGDKKLKAGDIINIDVTVIKDGYHGDTSRMFYVGQPSVQARRLCEITYECMWHGIAVVRAGANTAGAEAIDMVLQGNGFKSGVDYNLIALPGGTAAAAALELHRDVAGVGFGDRDRSCVAAGRRRHRHV